MKQADGAQKLVDVIAELTQAVAKMAMDLRVEKQMVELLFAVSHTHHPETKKLLELGKAALDAREQTSDQRAYMDAFRKRADELIAINKIDVPPAASSH